MNKSNRLIISALILLVVICCCLMFTLMAAGIVFYNPQGWYATSVSDNFPTFTREALFTGTAEINVVIEQTPTFQPSPTPTREGGFTPTSEPTQEIEPSATSEVTQTVTAPVSIQPATDTLLQLEKEVVPTNDLRDLAGRLEGKTNISETVPSPQTPYKEGDQLQFWVTNMDTNKNFQITATLWFITEHAYVWVQNGVNYDRNDMKQLADTFSNNIYPTDREFFGSEWTPGIDGDPRLYIIFTRGMGNNIAGYFSSNDEVPPEAHPYSNAHEDFMLNADNIDLSSQFTYGVLAHEFQHMIHWYRDRNEEAWLNEGFSELAAFLNGYYESGFDVLYTSNPDLQLNDWPNNENETTPHYGAGFLFLEYFLERFGEKATQALVANPDNGLDSVDGVLQELGIVDNVTHQPVTADNVFEDWVVANLLHDKSVGDGRYTYQRYSNAPQTNVTESFDNCPIDWQDSAVHQYGVKYIEISCPGNYTLNFEGKTEVGVLAEKAHSGSYAFWSNKGDESDITLTREFDFSDVSGPINLSYWVWYDLEKDYDYIYLEASEDGQNWQILQTPSCTTDNPSGNSYGCGYNGTSGNWINQKVDLSMYAGKKVQLRFEYVTDAAVVGEGLLLDDISIAEINYSTDFEKDDGGWNSNGFVRMDNRLPQTYQVSLIKIGDTITVETIPLTVDEKFSVPISIGGSTREVVLVVSGTTRFTRQLAEYRLSVQP